MGTVGRNTFVCVTKILVENPRGHPSGSYQHRSIHTLRAFPQLSVLSYINKSEFRTFTYKRKRKVVRTFEKTII